MSSPDGLCEEDGDVDGANLMRLKVLPLQGDSVRHHNLIHFGLL